MVRMEDWHVEDERRWTEKQGWEAQTTREMVLRPPTSWGEILLDLKAIQTDWGSIRCLTDGIW